MYPLRKNALLTSRRTSPNLWQVLNETNLREGTYHHETDSQTPPQHWHPIRCWLVHLQRWTRIPDAAHERGWNHHPRRHRPNAMQGNDRRRSIQNSGNKPMTTNYGDQRKLILEAEDALGIGPVELAKRLQTPYHTLKDWKSERAVMPGIAYVAIDILIYEKSLPPST